MKNSTTDTMGAIIDKKSDKPLFYQVMEHFRCDITEGHIPPGSLLPPATQLAKQLGINYRTVKQAYDSLANLGLVENCAGRVVAIDKSQTRLAAPDSIALVSYHHLSDSSMISISEDHYIFTLFYSIFHSATQLGYKIKALDITSCHDIDLLTNTKWAGMVYLFPFDAAFLNLPSQALQNTPSVSIGCEYDNICSVNSDDSAGIKSVMTHLYNLKHRRIAFIASRLRDHAVQQRLRGYLDFMKQKKLSIHPGWLNWYNSYALDIPESLEEICNNILQAPQRPTAIVCAQANVAAQMIHLVNERGLSVPDDISITGYDDSEVAALSNPPLTTVAQPMKLLGREAMRTLQETMESPQLLRKLLPTKLIIRKSTSVAP